ncbi:MAG: NADH-quinone oxidoreductase subunit J family protein [Planctomycetota bacterium]|jgi:NADH-quinone oxidoreductase subunit J
MAPTYLYTASVLGAIGLYLVMRSWPAEHTTAGANRARAARAIGAVLGLGVFGYLIVRAADVLGTITGTNRPDLLFVVFSGVALIAAVKLITHRRPVYSALYFVIVVLSSAGLFMLLAAEFMAFALVIVYAGAILITYMFVLMLAQQSPSGDEPHGQPEYDLNPRDPAVGAVVGFVLLALLSRMVYDGTPELPLPPGPRQARIDAWLELQRMPGRLEEFVAAEADGPFTLETIEAGPREVPRMEVAGDGLTATVFYATEDGVQHTLALPAEARPENVQRVGLALVSPRFPFAIEMAGVILTMAMLGAVVLARRQIELTEDDKREAAGLRRLGHHDDSVGREGGTP